MAMLGDILAEARSSAAKFQARLAAADPDLSARVTETGARLGETPAEFVRASISDFGYFAAEEDWATLTSRLRSSADPGFACLTAMVEWRLAQARKSGHGTVEEGADGGHA